MSENWATAPAAYAEARRRIAMAVRDEAKALNLSDLHGLERVPPEIKQASSLSDISLAQTKITDLTVFGLMSGLEGISLENAPIIDLSPLANIANLRNLDLDGTLIHSLEVLRNLTSLRICGYLVHLRPTFLQLGNALA